MGNLIKICDVSFRYGGEKKNVDQQPVLNHISLEIGRGEFVALVGPNGSGKSTLARMLNGLLLPSEGSIVIDGLDTRMPENLMEVRRRVGMVFQNPDNQLFASIVEEDVAFGVENLCLPPADIRDRVQEALERVGMSDYRHYPPHKLSGGQKQKVAIAGILAMQPKCIVLDEPTSMLDAKGKFDVLEAVRLLNLKNNMTIIYVTHDINEVLYCHSLAALAEGNIIYHGGPEHFFNDAEALRMTGLSIPPIKALVKGLKEEGMNIKEEIKSPEELVNAVCP